MPISSITIKNVASYNSEGVILDDLTKLNFFIGYNGTGKSTIARYLRNVSLKPEEQDSIYADCSLSGYNPSQEIILVYDEQFKKRNFITSNKLKGVFSLNQKNAEIDKKILLCESELNKIEQKKIALERRKETCDVIYEKRFNSKKNTCFEIRKQFKSFVKATFKYGNNKDQFFHHLESYLDNLPKHQPNYDDICKEYNKLYEIEIYEINQHINISAYEEIKKTKQKLEKLLKKIIVGSNNVDIAALIQELHMSGWVAQGRNYLAQSNGKCPFCQQKLNNQLDLLNKLNLFFDEQYQRDIDEIRNTGNKYHSEYTDLKGSIELLRKNTIINNECIDLLDKLNSEYDNIITTVQKKLRNPNEIMDLDQEDDFGELIVSINNLIKENNLKVRNLDSLKKEWVEKCWIYMAFEAKQEIIAVNNIKNFKDINFENIYNTHCNVLNNQEEFYKKRIESLRKNTVNTKEAVDNINEILVNIGFTNFRIEEISSNKAFAEYHLIRLSSTSSEHVYDSLSEGEKTFISFLYFYQLCIGTDDMSHSALKKIIVIDDPVSSLDSGILFIVSAIFNKLAMNNGKSASLKKQFKDNSISQIFVLTHNLYFYKEISLDMRPYCKDCIHYRVYKPTGKSSKIDRSKHAFPTDDYSLLWETLRKHKDNSGIDENRNIMICNVMRRILDSYVNFIGLSQNGGNLTWNSINSLDSSDPRYLVASSFIFQINDESHGVSPFDSSYYSRIIRQDTTILYKAFKLIFDEIGPDHYNMMIN